MLRNRGLGRLGTGVIGPPVTSLTQRKRCFTSAFCEAVVSLRMSLFYVERKLNESAFGALIGRLEFGTLIDRWAKDFAIMLLAIK
uniref:SFRICE_007322 n=1 Tax=Spodoptera frugiperda TaxID=7108 RepID=A0A2H1VH12_SPOFR